MFKRNGIATHFYTTLTVAQQQKLDQFIAAFHTTCTKDIEVLEANLKAASEQPNQTKTAFPLYERPLVPRVYRGQPAIKEQLILTTFIENLHDAQIRWELQKNESVNPDAALALAVDLDAFMETDPILKSRLQATVDMVSATLPQPLMATASNSQDGVMGTVTQIVQKGIRKTLSQSSQTSSHSRSRCTDGRLVRLNSPGPDS